MGNGLIDYDKSNIDAKQYIYYPIVEPLFSSLSSSAATIEKVAEKDESSLSLLSNWSEFDNISQYSSTIYEKITKNVSESWLFSEIIGLLRYRIDTDSIQGPLADYLNNHEKFKILGNDDYQEIHNNVLEDDGESLHHNVIEDSSNNDICCNCDDMKNNNR